MVTVLIIFWANLESNLTLKKVSHFLLRVLFVLIPTVNVVLRSV